MTPPNDLREVVSMIDQDRFPVRKHPRMRNYDYTTPNYYFVTICTKHKACIFGSATQISTYGRIAQQGLLEIPKHFPGIRMDKYIVMPNHIHAIIVLEDGARNLSTIIGQYKSYVTRCIHKLDPRLEVWQSSYHDHVIRDQQGYEQIWNYIDGNLQKWQDDCYFVQ